MSLLVFLFGKIIYNYELRKVSRQVSQVCVMKKNILVLFMLLAIFSGLAPETVLADSTDSSADSEFNQKIDSLLDQKGYSGTLLVVKNGKPIYQTSRGFANYANGIDNDKNTTYEIDSVQKSMTAAMIMKQVQDGKLKLSDKLAKFYPQIPGSKKITIRQMLDMTSGLILKGDIGPSRILSDEDIIHEDITNIKFSNFLHGKWDYQAINFNLLSGILEKLTGESYRQLFTDTFIKKLDLDNTIFAYDNDPNILKATGYNNIDPLSSRLDYKNAFYTRKWFEFDELGTGQIYMSANDLYKVEKYIMTGSYLSKKSRKELFKPGSGSTYGGGLYHRPNDNFANGWGYGFQTVMHISHNGKNAVIVLENYSRLAADIKPAAKTIYQMVNEK